MALFIITEAMFFVGLISGFLVLRAQAPAWPPLDQPRLPVEVTGFNTFLLLVSAGTIMRAFVLLRRGAAAHGSWLGATALLGGAFLAIQGYEWVRLVHYGLTTSSSLYGSTFYVLVGAHGLHVLGALVALLVIWRGALAGRYGAGDDIRLMPMLMYWLFVVAIWPILYVLVYLQ
jgi:cytochrome c oxidase subunit 3